MKFLLFLSFTFTVLWITANGASIETNDASSDENIAPNITDAISSFYVCGEKLCKQELYKDRCEDASHFLDGIRKNIKQQLEKEGSPKNLDTILQHTCNSIMSRDVVYNVTIDLLKDCSKQEILSTPEEILIAKEKLKQRNCYIDVRFVILMDYDDTCKPETAKSIKECLISDYISNVPLVDRYIGSPKICTSLAETTGCRLKVYRDNCDAALSKQWELYFDALYNFNECNFCQNSTSSANSSVE